MTREQILELLCDQALQGVFLPREMLMAELRTWDIKPYWHEGACTGAILRRGPQFHFATFKRVPISRAVIADALQPQIEEYGYVETRTPREYGRQRRFNELIGFRAIDEDDYDIHYRMERAQCRL